MTYRTKSAAAKTLYLVQFISVDESKFIGRTHDPLPHNIAVLNLAVPTTIKLLSLCTYDFSEA